MADYVVVYTGIGALAVILGVLLYRMITIIEPGYIGLVYILRRYRRAIHPGFWVVSAIATVRKVQPGSGVNHVLGLVGLAESELSNDNTRGKVRVGEVLFSARGLSQVRKGASVRVLDDIGLGEILVAPEAVPS